ncbi:hypothetical protein [Agrobacterium rosae]|uniref:Uncharacterized protein n=1 Tax=Agrobacterium rosae TaxID=1972867 RepID=A0AAW9FLG1_9HYPH|nr:hypothetical protein [Agrobacterium rosae]MDX8303775.1 hypothetical protein [Agrobacterium rosae]POO56765.1 hypothetical protein CTT39_08845 [Agrobacterium rosae]
MNIPVTEKQTSSTAAQIHGFPLTAEWLSSQIFALEAGPQRRQVTSILTFEKDGRIGGYKHPNEAYWQIQDEKLFILREDGTVSCVAIVIKTSGDGVEIVGPVVPSEEMYLHHFRPLGPRVSLPTVQTFDLFDTLVARYCVDPLEIFRIVEAKSRTQDFAKLRQNVEATLWRGGNYSLDDVYVGLGQAAGWSDATLAHLKMLELGEEWNNLFQIQEMISRVQHDDLIISDMYLPASFLRKIVDKKCGLPGLKIHLSNHGKHHGTIWPEILSTHRILRHFGDNHHSDVVQARKAGINAEYVTVSGWTEGEAVLVSIGLVEFAKAVRKARLTSFSFEKMGRQAQLAQFDSNIPLLIIAALLLIRHAHEAGADSLLMCGRDSNMWVHLVEWMVGISQRKMAVHYFPSSRELLLSKNPAYAAYFTLLRGQRTIIADVSGTGRSPANFVANIQAQEDTSVFVVLKSNRIDGPMEIRAPARDDVQLECALTVDLERFLFERFNTAAREDRAVDIEFLGEEFRIVREHEPVSATVENLIDHMQEAFALTLSILKEAPIFSLPQTTTDEQLREALQQLIHVGMRYFDLAKMLPE